MSAVKLAELMREWRDKPEEWADHRRPVDRIVLYIDDLDRCRPDQVVEVLQAVHLLLAFELFVVVVGVDPNWLLRSLRSQYADLLHDGLGGPAENRHTPEDYLEKILNIPLALPAMPSGSLDRLLRSFSTVRAEVRSTETSDSQGAEDNSPASRPDSGQVAAAADITIETGSEVDAQRRAGGRIERPRPLTEPEITLLAALDPLIDTPREAKRLLNLYRMVRATRDLSEASRFLGMDGRPGEYQAVVVLFGLLTVRAHLLGSVLDAPPEPANGTDGGLTHRPRETSWDRFVAGVEPQRSEQIWANRIVGPFPDSQLAEWTRLHRGLVRVSTVADLADLTDLHAWLPRIRRFSYLLL
ncbi:P-loop NTPase fold protein [Nocardia sp. NPDC052278]|uniref:P-loop NTPase fold protein n=1 Tax=unclassified Nocardia TaxID=2637762 RepID=UPI00368F1853